MQVVSWLRCAAEEVPAGDDWLGPAERAAAAGFRVQKRRADWRLGRFTAKRALARWLDGERPDALEVLAAADGSPRAYRDGQPLPLTLSLSHRAGQALCAVTAGEGIELGCDLERIEPRSEGFVSDYLTAAEQRLVQGAVEAEQPLLANLLWSAKESVLKALRVGLGRDPRALEVEPAFSPRPSGWRPLAVIDLGSGRSFGGCWRRQGELLLTVVMAGRCPEPTELARTARAPV